MILNGMEDFTPCSSLVFLVEMRGEVIKTELLLKRVLE